MFQQIAINSLNSPWHHHAGAFPMIAVRRPNWLQIMVAAGLLYSASAGFAAQQPDVGDQPGLLPDESVQHKPEFQKQMVLYRTNELPGTIIIATAERHQNQVQGNGKAMR